MLLIPQVKKKITGFVKDENGTISKGNLIKGGILLGSIGASVNIVEAFWLRDGNTIPGTTRRIPVDGCFKPIYYNCAADAPVEGRAPDTMAVPRTVCETGPGNGVFAPFSGNNRHTNSGTIVHRNANRDSHRNTVGFSKGIQEPDNLVGAHSHHGQHFNINSVAEECGSVDHKSNCWHSNHSKGGWC